MSKSAKASPCREAETKPMAERPRFKTIEGGPRIVLGLCANCNQQTTCMYLASAKRPVLACEEFSIDESTPRPEATTAAEQPALEPGRLLGLCGTCEGAKSCMYASGGRWRCEEYR